MDGFRCPGCGAGLQREAAARGVLWVCPSCGGHSAGIGLLRRALDVSFANALWLAATERGTESDRSCAVCAQPMVGTDTSPSLDVCKGCRFVWFDPGEFDLSPPPSGAPTAESSLSQEQLEVVGRIQVAEIAEQWRGRPDAEIGEQLALIPGLLGMPVEEVAPEIRRDPWITWGLAVLLVFTSFLFDVGVFALLSNIYFLWVFGDNVEDFLGRTNYALLLAVAAGAGVGVHALFGTAEVAAFSGATAAVSSLIVFYGLRFPQARLRYFRLFRWLSMPAAAATGFWVVTQIVGARSELSGTGDAPYLASLGGGAVGLWFWFLWRND